MNLIAAKISARWRSVALIVLVVVYTCALQGARGLYSLDEGRYTNVALMMLESGDWLHPRLHPEDEHWSKPPLTYWAIATSVKLFGHSEFAARLPGALAFAGTIFALFRLGQRFVPEQPWLPALVYASFGFPLLAANMVTTDTLLAFFETLEVVGFVDLWWAATPAAATRARRLLWLACGLAFMTKGPPGLLALAGCMAFAMWSGGVAALRRLFAWDALALFVVVGFTWYAIVVVEDPNLLRYFLVEEVVNRVATDKMGRNAEWYGALKVYLPTLLLGTLPWLPILLRALWRHRRDALAHLRACEPARLLVCWFALPFAVFMLSRSRLPLYLLPLFAPLALLVARQIAPLDLNRHGRLFALAAWCVFILALRALPMYFDIARDDRRLSEDLLARLGGAAPNEIAFVATDARFGLHFYLGSSIERLEFPQSEHTHSHDVVSEIGEREGCRLWLVNDWNLGRLQSALASAGAPYQQLAAVHNLIPVAQMTPDCPRYSKL